MTLFVEQFDDEVLVLIGGTYFGGWTKVKVTRTVKDLAGTFEVGLAQSLETPIDFILEAQPGVACEIWVAGRKFITGYINSRKAKKNKKKHTITISGRSKTQDLVDCSHIDDKTQYNKQKPSQIVTKAAQPFGISVINQAQGEVPIDVYRYFVSDSAFEVSGDVSRQQGITLRDDENGNVVMRNRDSGSMGASLVEGENILEYEVTRGDQKRHSKYKGKGQKNPGSKKRGKKANQIAYRAEDRGVKRYRPLVVYGESDIDTNEMKTRTAHEAMRRFGEALSAEIKVVGYRANAGAIWEPDKLVPVTIPEEGINESLLIESVTFIKDEEDGTITELKVTRKEAFQGKAASAGGVGGGGAGGGAGAGAGGQTFEAPDIHMLPEE